jgi:nitric oxide dioxygenase
MSLTQEQIAIVKSTVPILQIHGETITTTFYRNVLRDHPELRNIFSLRSQQTGAQQSALAKAVFAYASYIDDLPRLAHAVERIAHKHTSLFIKPEHYPIVGKYLVAAFAEVLGDALTDEVAAAWIAAYNQLANVFIQREAQLYKEAGDWDTWRKFKIAKKQAENSTVTNLELVPVDGKALPTYLPGQYISLQIPVPEAGDLVQSRQYSLASAPAAAHDRYCISVKREETTLDTATTEELVTGKIPGLISNLLLGRYNEGDIVELSPPHGEFFVDASDTSAVSKPLVLLSAGIGAAPLVAILDSVIDSPSAARPISWIHTARSSDTACYTKHIRDVAAKHQGVRCKVVLKNIQPQDVEGETYDISGRLDLSTLIDKERLLYLDDVAAEYYICGPEPWMVEVRSWLVSKGVPLERQHLELFKTGDV